MTVAPSIAYVIEPRFPGGTSSAVASELRWVRGLWQLTVFTLNTRMFHGRETAPQLSRVFEDARLQPQEDPQTVAADLVVLHNPAMLKFQESIATRIVARHLVVVTHENFLRPGGDEAFSVATCLDQINRNSLSLRKSLAPVSRSNRETVEQWLSSHDNGNWDVLPEDWINICDFEMRAPVSEPGDHRGRLSRPGFEKFPSLKAMDATFPPSATSNVILGADTFMAEGLHRPHWKMIPFQGMSVGEFFGLIDFMVYFTAPTWRESFGRVIAEGIAAGKVVICDHETASNFDGAAMAAHPDEVDNVIEAFMARPDLYRDFVLQGQQKLRRYSGEAFRSMVSRVLGRSQELAA